MALASTPQYNSFTAALQAVCEREFGQLLSGLSHPDYLVLCGRLQARLEILALPDTLEQKAREIDEHSRSAPSTPDTSKRDLTFFGSPFWGRTRNGTG